MKVFISTPETGPEDECAAILLSGVPRRGDLVEFESLIYRVKAVVWMEHDGCPYLDLVEP